MTISVPKLGVNVDHVATVRQARLGVNPDPVAAATLASLAAAEIITLHLREDRRHAQDRDLEMLKKTVSTKLNLEMALTDAMVEIALNTLPDQVTLVPEKRQELTTEGGLDIPGVRAEGKTHITRLRDAGIRVSLFIDPAPEQIAASAQVGAQCVELHTGPYANAGPNDLENELIRLESAAKAASKAGLVVNAGHGLDYFNVGPLVKRIACEELHIGHSIIARAVLVGMERAVRDMKALIYNSCLCR